VVNAIRIVQNYGKSHIEWLILMGSNSDRVNRDHLKSHSQERSEVCEDCGTGYIYKRDLVEHRRDRCQFRFTSAAQPITQNPPPMTSQAPNPRNSSSRTRSDSESEDPALLQPIPQNRPTQPNLDEGALQAFKNRHPPLHSAMTDAEQVQQQLDDNFEARWARRQEGDIIFLEMLGDGSEFEKCDYSVAPDRVQSGDRSASLGGSERVMSVGRKARETTGSDVLAVVPTTGRLNFRNLRRF